jgi:hypothetical protein
MTLLKREMALRFAERLGVEKCRIANVDIQRQRKRYEFDVMRSRVLERKRAALAAVRSRRVVESRTRINQWRRQQLWLKDFESRQDQQAALQEFSDSTQELGPTGIPCETS